MFGTSCTCKKWLPPPDILLHRLKTICTPGRCKTKNVCHHSNPPAAPVHRIKNGCQPLHIQNKMVATPPTQAKCLVHPAVTVHKLNDCHTLHRLPPVHAKKENNVAAPLPTPTPATPAQGKKWLPHPHRAQDKQCFVHPVHATNGCHPPCYPACTGYKMVASPCTSKTKWLPPPPPCTA